MYIHMINNKLLNRNNSHTLHLRFRPQLFPHTAIHCTHNITKLTFNLCIIFFTFPP